MRPYIALFAVFTYIYMYNCVIVATNFLSARYNHCYICDHYSYLLNNMQTYVLNTIILVNNSMFIRNVFNCFITVCIIIGI